MALKQLLLACALALAEQRTSAQPARCRAAYGDGVPRTVSSACWPNAMLPKHCTPQCASRFNPFWKVCRSTQGCGFPRFFAVNPKT